MLARIQKKTNEIMSRLKRPDDHRYWFYLDEARDEIFVAIQHKDDKTPDRKQYAGMALIHTIDFKVVDDE